MLDPSLQDIRIKRLKRASLFSNSLHLSQIDFIKPECPLKEAYGLDPLITEHENL